VKSKELLGYFIGTALKKHVRARAGVNRENKEKEQETGNFIRGFYLGLY
jgi:hypothetical protein